jgi:hypothetical protein
MKAVVERLKKPTPKFFKKLRGIGFTIAAAGAAIASAPVALPALLVKIAGYLVVAGTVASTVSQAAVKNEKQ